VLAALYKHLSYDILHQMKEAEVLFSTDAKSCYDRILYLVQALSLQRLDYQKVSLYFDTLNSSEMRGNG
jgi:hypothetical protein